MSFNSRHSNTSLSSISDLQPIQSLSSRVISKRIAKMHSSSSTSAHNSNKNLSNDLNDDSAQRRRSSSRSIKRKKFDDELVDSMSTSYPKPKGFKAGDSGDFTITENSQTVEHPVPQVEIPVPVPLPAAPVPTTSKKSKASLSAPSTSSTQKKKSRKQHSQPLLNLIKYSENNNYWKPIDDLALILNIEQTNSLTKVYNGTKFSCKFTFTEIESRWRSLLYDIDAKSLALAAIRQLHPDVVNAIEVKTLLSDAEEALIKKIESRNPPTLESLNELINSNPGVFLSSRTPKILLNHWQLFRHYQLLSDQTLQPLPRLESVVNFSEIESTVRKEVQEEINNSSGFLPNEMVNQEIMHGIRKNMLEIRMLENEIPKYQALLDSITGIAPSDFDNQTYAVLRGRLVRYLMRSKEITIGRSTKDVGVDVDLSLEGPSTKISRLQAMICLQPTGEFIVYNTGKRAVYIDSKPLLPDSSLRINHNALIEFAALKFIFLINQDLISNMRNEVLQLCK